MLTTNDIVATAGITPNRTNTITENILSGNLLLCESFKSSCKLCMSLTLHIIQQCDLTYQLKSTTVVFLLLSSMMLPHTNHT